MSLKDLAQQMKSRGRKGDTELVHMTKGEVAGLQQLAMAAGGSLTINPDTGLPEASFLKQLLPTIIGVGVGAFAGPMAGAAAGAAVGGATNKQDPFMGALMGGLGGYGGAGIGAGLTGAGAGAAQNAAMSGLTDTAARNLAAGQATSQFAAQPMMSQMGQGVQALMQPGGAGQFVQSMGGGMGALKAGSMAAAPAMYDSMTPRPMGGMEGDDAVLPRYDYTAGLTGDYYQPGQGTFERRYFTDPTFTRRAAAGGVMDLAEGGIASLARGGMKAGGFVVPADVVSMVGEGNTDAGYERIQRKMPGATPIRGKDGGQADTVKTSIEGKQPARIAHGEMYVPPEAVKKAGGAKKLYAMMDKVRKQATGSTKQIKPVKALA